MTIRLPSISATPVVPFDGFAICNSRGRRVSLLNDDEEPFGLPFHCPLPSHQRYPPSPARTFDSEPANPSCGSFSYSHPSPLTTSPSIPPVSPLLPPVNDLISFTIPKFDLQGTESRKSSVSSVSSYSGRASLLSAGSRRGSNHSTHSKGNKRRYECSTCGKTFTTSGHVARHNRIHTGEKNFQCPELGCSQRFSRQDNCMQHFRTHKNHAQIALERPSSAEWMSPVTTPQRNKRRRTDKNEDQDISIDPNDRLSALATYISVYA